MEQPPSPRGCGAFSPENTKGPEAGVPGPVPHSLALRLPVSSAAFLDQRSDGKTVLTVARRLVEPPVGTITLWLFSV